MTKSITFITYASSELPSGSSLYVELLSEAGELLETIAAEDVTESEDVSGLYTAEIQTAISQGSYQVIVRLDMGSTVLLERAGWVEINDDNGVFPYQPGKPAPDSAAALSRIKQLTALTLCATAGRINNPRQEDERYTIVIDGVTYAVQHQDLTENGGRGTPTLEIT